MVPRDLKAAIVTPLLKITKSSPDILKNFRPVLQLPFISKMLEKIYLGIASHIFLNIWFMGGLKKAFFEKLVVCEKKEKRHNSSSNCLTETIKVQITKVNNKCQNIHSFRNFLS